MGRVVGLCISEKRGTQKTPMEEVVFVEGYGIKDDAHGGDWHRQVSLISNEQIEAFKARGADVSPGAFGENVIVEGFDFKAYPVGTQFMCNDVLLEMTQIGKKCHHHCQIYYAVGDCIMPREGVFARVLKGGTVKLGDEMRLVE